jgi:hypothetical protein
MRKVFVHMASRSTVTSTGPNRSAKNPMGGVPAHSAPRVGVSQQAFRQELGIPGRGEDRPDNDAVKRTFRAHRREHHGQGACFDGRRSGWPRKAPFHNSVFVLTTKKREPCVRVRAERRFYFVNDSLEARPVDGAREAAGEGRVRISGGRRTSSSSTSTRSRRRSSTHLDVAPRLPGRRPCAHFE